MTFTAIPLNSQGEVKNDFTRSAFGECSVVNPSPIIQQSFEYTTSNTELTTNSTTAAATITQANAMAVLSTLTTTGGRAKMISKNKARYRAGQGGLCRFTSLFSSPVAGTNQLCGLADEDGSSQEFKNGYCLGYIGTTFGIHRFIDDTIQSIALSACDDPLDGTGASKMTIDQTKINVFQIKFQYLGAGEITYSIENPDTGLFVPFHKIKYANGNLVPSVYMPNFHITFMTNNGATTSNIVMKTASFSYFVEGQTEYTQIHHPLFNTGNRSKTSITTETNLFTLRNKSTYASKTNFVDIVPIQLSGSVIKTGGGSGTNLAHIILTLDATLGGSPSYTDINTNNSVCDIDVSGTTVSGKQIFTYPLIDANDKFIIDLSPYKIIIQPNTTLTISAVSTAASDFVVSMAWQELF